MRWLEHAEQQQVFNLRAGDGIVRPGDDPVVVDPALVVDIGLDNDRVCATVGCPDGAYLAPSRALSLDVPMPDCGALDSIME